MIDLDKYIFGELGGTRLRERIVKLHDTYADPRNLIWVMPAEENLNAV